MARADVMARARPMYLEVMSALLWRVNWRTRLQQRTDQSGLSGVGPRQVVRDVLVFNHGV
jgi:hypothetical protein